MNHKRGRAKNARAGCLMCNSHKVNGARPASRLKASERRRIQDDPDIERTDQDPPDQEDDHATARA